MTYRDCEINFSEFNDIVKGCYSGLNTRKVLVHAPKIEAGQYSQESGNMGVLPKGLELKEM